jgi:hypothetical protein
MANLLATGFLSTFGDLLALETVRNDLERRGHNVVIAPLHSFLVGELEGATAWKNLPRDSIDAILVVCGPVPRKQMLNPLLSQFPRAKLYSMGQSLDSHSDDLGRFLGTFFRDFDGRTGSPDLSFLSETSVKPRIGVCLIDEQPEYGSLQGHSLTKEAIDVVLRSIDAVRIDLDTRYPAARNQGGVRTANEFVSLLRGVDVVVTNRLHGVALALQQGVPVVAIDSIKGAGKVMAQARTLGWPFCMSVDDLDLAELRDAISLCQGEPVRALARHVASAAKERLNQSFSAFASDAFGAPIEAPIRKPIVYTAIVGGIDSPPLPPVLPDDCEFICFTDNTSMKCDGWRTEPLPWPAESSTRRTSRRIKTMSHKLFGMNTASAWFDATFTPRISVRTMVTQHLGDADIATVSHPWRDCIYTEAEACVEQHKDTPATIREQMTRYRAFGMPARNGLVASGVLLRKHTDQVRRFNESWWDEIRSGSCRDQLSFDFVRWLTKTRLTIIPGDYYSNTSWSYKPHLSVENQAQRQHGS